MTSPADALDALFALWTTALPTVQVVDGPPAVDIRGDVLVVGFTPEDLSMAAVAEIADLRGGDNETFTVYSVARSWSGSADLAPVRRRCYDTLTAAKAALRGDPTLGGKVARARYAGHTYMPSRNEQGQLIVDLVFPVAINTFG